jgi:hypothetical protein
MRRAAAVLSTAAMVIFAVGVFAQGKDFSGKWTADAEKTAAANPAMAAGGGGRGGGRGGGGGDMTITQDAKTLTIERTMGGNAVKTVYNLDGSDSKNQQAGRGGAAPTEVVSNAKWDGAKLVITTHGANGDQVTSWYMDGASLVSERTGQNGAQKTYYKKAS